MRLSVLDAPAACDQQAVDPDVRAERRNDDHHNVDHRRRRDVSHGNDYLPL